MQGLAHYLELLAEALPYGIVILDHELTTVFMNERHVKANALPRAAMIGRSPADYLPAPACAIILPKLHFVLDNKVPLINQEIRSASVDGGPPTFHRLASYYPLLRDQQCEGIVAVIRDSKMDDFTTQLVHEHQLLFLRALDDLFAFVGVLDLDGTVVDANHAALSAANLRLDDVRGRKFWECDWWHCSSAVKQQLYDAVRRGLQGTTSRIDLLVQRHDGAPMWIDFTLAPLRDAHGQITHLVPSATDITPRRLGEQALEKAVSEKTMLLQEVHHRVKNNLQIISSLLNLQARNTSGDLEWALRDSQSRIKVMALVHQLLFESEDMSRIDLHYFLDKAAKMIASMYGVGAQSFELIVRCDDAQIVIDPQKAVPCGLLMAELITNAFKHAFPEGGGRIAIDLSYNKSSVKLTIADNGVGLPVGFCWGSEGSLGKQLVPMFVEQLAGVLTTQSDKNGTSISVEFRL